MKDSASKILLVDPSSEQAAALKELLEAEGYEVITADDGESALLAFEKQAPQLVILETLLPGLSGLEVCESIKERSSQSFVPVLFLSSAAGPDEKSAGYDAGADDYLAKPVEFRELIARLKSLRKVQAIANRDHARTMADMSFDEAESYPGDEVLKIVADRLAADRQSLFRFINGNTLGYLAVNGFRFTHARIGVKVGRAALNEMLEWPAQQVESVTLKRLKPSLDVDFEDVVDAWVAKLDGWRLLTERLPARETILYANGDRKNDLGNVGPSIGGLLTLFQEPVALDQALRRCSLDLPEAVRGVGELYYRGLLLRRGAAPAEWKGAPLVGNAAGHPAAHAPAHDGDDEILSQQLEELQLETLSLTATNGRLSDELAAERAKVEGRLPDYERRQNEKQAALVAAEARLAELDNELVSLKRRYVTRLKDIAAKSAGGIVDSVVEQFSMDLQDAHHFAVNLQNGKKIAERELVALRDEIGTLRASLQEMQVLTERLQKQSQAAGTQDTLRLQHLQGEVVSLKTQLAESSAARQKLQEKVRAEGGDPAERSRLLSEIANVQERLSRAVQAGEQTKLQASEETANLKAQLAAATQGREALLREWQETSLQEQERIHLLEVELEARRSGGEASPILAKDPAAGQELSRLRAALSESQSQVEKLSGEAASADSLRSQLAQVESDRERLLNVAAEESARMRAKEDELLFVRVALDDVKAKLLVAEGASDARAPEDGERVKRAEQELALLKAELAETMVDAERAASEQTAAFEAQEKTLQETAERLSAELEMVREQLQGAHSSMGAGSQGESEAAFLRAKLAEAEKNYRDELSSISAEKMRLVEQLLSVSQQGEGGAGGGEDTRLAESEKLRGDLQKALDRISVLDEKLELAAKANQKNVLLARAQEQADTLHTMRGVMREKDAEIEKLRAASSGGSTGGDAEIQELKSQIQALRFSVIERDEEIVELTARIEEDSEPVPE